MAQCSQHKRAVSPETVVVSDDEGFVAVALDDQYVTSYFLSVGNLERFIVLSLELMKRRMLMILSIQWLKKLPQCLQVMERHMYYSMIT